MPETTPPTTVFISYSHDSPTHLDRILALSNLLRSKGVDCIIDQYEQSPAEGWPQWCDNQIERSTFVLVACTEIYLRRFKKQESPNTGLGVTWEGHIITQELYNAQGRNTKFIPIIFTPDDAPSIPLPLQSAARYQLPDSYSDLYRRLTAQPATPKPALGAVQPMPAREPLPSLPGLVRQQDFQPPFLVPYPRNPFFTGRKAILTGLRTLLEKHNRVALTGFGGLGKTQTALEYAFRHRAQYTAVFFTNADTRDTLLADFVRIAGALNLPSAQAQDQSAIVAEVQRWLETSPGWLLILDNADDLVLAKEFLPRDSTGHVLLTTRARALAGVAERLAIEEMPPEEGAQLLLRRAHLPADPETQPIALQISQELGHLPLALDQAGAFIEETPSTLAEYLNFYLKERGKLLAQRGTLGDHPSVSVTFSLAFQKTADHSPAAADLIRLCAFLAPDAIPEEIFLQGAKHLGKNLSTAATSGGLAFADVLKEATRFSLIDRDAATKTLDIHRLVQAVIVDAMSAAEQEHWAQRAVRAVDAAFPKPEFINWELCQKFLPHAQACAVLIDKWHLQLAQSALLLNEAGRYLGGRALFAEAEQLYQRSLAIYEKVLGPDHPNVATSLNNLAALYKHQGKYAEAEPLFQRSLAIREKTLGADHPGVAAVLNNLAELYRNQGKYAEAEPLFQRSLAIREKALGADHPDVAQGLNNLAALYDDQGKYAEAEPLYQRSLAIREKALGPNHPDVATVLNNLALLYSDQGKYAEAEPLYQRSLAIRDKALGPDHPDLAITLNNLATLYESQSKYAEAERLYERSLTIFNKALGPDHPYTTGARSNLEQNRQHRLNS